MTEEEALEELSRRASRSNLSFDIRYYEGRYTPVVVTVMEYGETIDDMIKFQTAFGAGVLFVGKNGKTVWDALDEDAIIITKKLIPILSKNRIGDAQMKLAYANNMLAEWRRRG